MIKTFYDLEIYQRSYKAALELHRLSKAFPKDEQYGLTNQIRRASRSIPANIAEGFSKHHKSNAEFKRFLNIAIGSCNEMIVWIDFSYDLAYIDEVTSLKLKKEYEELGKMMFKLAENWKSFK